MDSVPYPLCNGGALRSLRWMARDCISLLHVKRIHYLIAGALEYSRLA